MNMRVYHYIDAATPDDVLKALRERYANKISDLKNRISYLDKAKNITQRQKHEARTELFVYENELDFLTRTEIKITLEKCAG